MFFFLNFCSEFRYTELLYECAVNLNENEQPRAKRTKNTTYGRYYFMFGQQIKGSCKSQVLNHMNHYSNCILLPAFPRILLPGSQWVKIRCLILKSEKVALQWSSLSESCSIQKRPRRWERSEQPRYWKRGLLASTISLSNKMLPLFSPLSINIQRDRPESFPWLRPYHYALGPLICLS